MRFNPTSVVPIGLPVSVLETLGRRNAAFARLHKLVLNQQTNAQRRAILRAELLETLKKGK